MTDIEQGIGAYLSQDGITCFLPNIPEPCPRLEGYEKEAKCGSGCTIWERHQSYSQRLGLEPKLDEVGVEDIRSGGTAC